MKYNKFINAVNSTGIMKKRRQRFRRHYPRANSALGLVKQIPFLKNSVRMLKGIVNAELKRFDTQVNAASPTTTWTIGHITNIAAGDDVGDRDGNSILAKYLSLNQLWIKNGSATNSLCRLMVFVDTGSPRGTPITSSVLFEDDTRILTPINRDVTPRIIVLRDYQVVLDSVGQQMYEMKDFIKLNFHIKYTGTSSNNFDKNSIFIAYASSEATNAPAFNFYSRIAFYDN